MMNFQGSISGSLSRYRATIGYVILLLLVAISLSTSYRLQQSQLHHQAFRQCEAGNETRKVLDHALQVLAAPRDSDGPGDHEERMRLYGELIPLIELRDCERVANEVTNTNGDAGGDGAGDDGDRL